MKSNVNMMYETIWITHLQKNFGEITYESWIVTSNDYLDDTNGWVPLQKNLASLQNRCQNYFSAKLRNTQLSGLKLCIS